MRRKFKTALALALVGGLGGVAAADTTYEFAWQATWPTFFKFASNNWIAANPSADAFDVDLDAMGDITAFDGPATNIAHPTTYTIGGNTLKAKVVFDDVAGSVDLGAETAVFTFTAHVTFSAGSSVSAGSCQTSSFTISFSGDYESTTNSSTTTVPSLSGTGTQACNGNASTINSDLALGGAGAELQMSKMVVTEE